jgi:hypothetical protein
MDSANQDRLVRLSLAALSTAVLTVMTAGSIDARQPCPATPVVTVSSPLVPADVCIPDGFGGNPINYFDDFSWRAFVAMVWPVEASRRGVPDATKTVSDPGPRVFETLKPEWEVFRPNGAAPSGWDDFDQDTPCGKMGVAFGDVLLASFSQFGNLGQAGPGTGALIHALPAQNKTWVRYLTGFNRLEYDQIVNDRLYLRAELQKRKPIAFADGALDVKSAWMDMSGVSDPDRYYRRQALVFDPVTNTCGSKFVGLIGIHIVVRTPSRPQWIWSTFEHVDNVPHATGSAPMALNDGAGTAMPTVDPNGGFPPNDWAAPQLYNVDRIKPIHAQTARTNTAYRAAMTGVWKNYQLVMTQWPLQKNPPLPIPTNQSGGPANTFPGLGATTAFANTTMETWEQDKVTTGCMACHTIVQNTDFLFTLEAHAFTPPPSPGVPPPAPTLSLEMVQLRSLLEEARKNATERSRPQRKK